MPSGPGKKPDARRTRNAPGVRRRTKRGSPGQDGARREGPGKVAQPSQRRVGSHHPLVRRSGGSTRIARRGPTRRFGRRVAILALVLALLVLTMSYPLRNYITQRMEIARLEAEQKAQSDRIAALEERKKRWEDPSYVKAQARKRLQYVLPGETAYVIIDPDEVFKEEKSDRGKTRTHGPWYDQVWSTFEASDRPVGVK